MHACIWKVHRKKRKNSVIFKVSIKIATRKPRSALKTKSDANSAKFLFIGCYKQLFWMNFNAARAPFNQLLFTANCRHSTATTRVSRYQQTSKLLYGIKMCKNMLKTKFMVLKFAWKKREDKYLLKFHPVRKVQR